MKQKLVFSFLFFCFLSISIFGQQQINGKITAVNDDENMAGVTIMVKGTTNGTISDIDGSFSIKVEPGDTLVVSYIGYKTQTIGITSQTSLNILLEEDLEEIEQVKRVI